MSIHREGYGAAFNEIEINGSIFKKKAKNIYGEEKIQKEIEWYSICEQLETNLPIPRRLSKNLNSLELEFYKDHEAFYKIFWKSSEEKQKKYLQDINSKLELFHKNCKQFIPREVLERDLIEETSHKIMSRWNEVKDVLSWCNFSHVNGIKILTLTELIDYIQKKINEYLPEIKSEYCLIHGDCQFNNILYFKDDYIFIDPRGYFGKTKVYGLPHYDRAKILFALTGYDIFDSMEVDSLSFENGNLYLPEIPCKKNIFDEITLDHIFMVSIWLGNAHCFRSNPMKAVVSHYYARYIGTLVYMSDTSLIK